jgi:uncharacterized protein (DUF1778 family)
MPNPSKANNNLKSISLRMTRAELSLAKKAAKGADKSFQKFARHAIAEAANKALQSDLFAAK